MRRPSSPVLVAAMLGAASTVAIARRGRVRTEAAVSGRTRLDRNFRLARLGARGSSRYALTQARKTFASAERREALNTEFQLKTAADVTAELGNMKGALMKIGQMASYVNTGLPDHVRRTMASLQNAAPSMSADLTADTIERAFGKSLDVLFQEWDPTPIASASIGQVHRAITWDDRAVAVKVQYPGVVEAVVSDLRNADWIFGAMGRFFPGLQTGPVVDELKQRLTEELDYRNEARNQRYFAAFFDRHPFFSVPRVVDHLSNERVLTSELAIGSSFDEVLTWTQDERNLAGEAVFRFSFGSIYRLHAFNGDPHPGNYLFSPDGKVTFLDFGLVKRFTPTETALFEQMVRSMMLERDGSRFRQVVEGAGLVLAGAPVSDEEVAEYFGFYDRYLLTSEKVTIDRQYASARVAHLFNADGEHGDIIGHLNVPPAFVILQRITLGLIGLFADLEASANWRLVAEELWPFVAGAPSTPMGAEIAAWRRQRGQAPMGI